MSINKTKYIPPVKMTDGEAITLWNTLNPEQRYKLLDLANKLVEGKMELVKVNVDDNEQIQNIVLEPKDKPSKPTEPFAKYFPQDNE